MLPNRRPGGSLCWVLAFSTASCHQRVWSPKLTDFLSSLSYIIVQSPTQYLPITGHRNVSLPPSLEWHIWSSLSGNNCHAVRRSLSSGASVCDCLWLLPWDFNPVSYCQPSSPKPMEYALPPSLEWHVWRGGFLFKNSPSLKLKKFFTNILTDLLEKFFFNVERIL